MTISERIAADYRARIRSGALAPSTYLPAIPALQEEYAHLGEDGSISEMPVRQALRELRTEGLIESIHGRGNRVAPPAAWVIRPVEAGPANDQ